MPAGLWILATLIALLAAFILNLTLLVYAAGVAALLFTSTNFLSRRWAAQSRGARQTNRDSAEVGDVATVSVEVRSAGGFLIPWVLAEDLLPEGDPRRLAVLGPRLKLGQLRGAKPLRWFYQVQCQHRGYYQIGPTVAETGDFFGLQRRYRVLGEPTYLLVYPKRLPLEGLEVASRKPVGEVVLTHRLFEDPTRISGVRAYQPGDPISRIHWRAPAHTGTLQCKKFEPSSLSGATLVLDFHQACFDPRHEPLRSELAVTAAASIADTLHQLNVQFGLVSNGADAADRARRQGWMGDWRTREQAVAHTRADDDSERLKPIVVPTGKGPERLDRLLRTLARLEFGQGLRLPALLVEAEKDLPRDAAILAFLSEVPLASAVALGMFRRRGYSVAAVLNCADAPSFARWSGPLIDEGVETLWLSDEPSIHSLCRRQWLTRTA